MHSNILITNAILQTEANQGTITDPAFLTITGHKIGQFGPMNSLPTDLTADKIIDATGCMVMPGLVNSHCHAAMTLFRGLADDLPLMTWLNEHIFPAEARNVAKEMVYWCSKLAAAEMILSGTTTVADGYFFEEEAAKAFMEIGLRAVAAQGIIDFPAPGVPNPTKNIEAASRYLHSFPVHNLLTPALFCHSPYTCSPQTMQAAKQLAREHNCKFFIHVSETKTEIENHQKQHNISPIQHLEKLNILDQDTVCVHCVWPNDKEISMLSHTGCGVITCPESNMKLASGVAPLTKMLASGVTVGIGTDGCASNNDLDMLQEIDTLAKLHKVVNLDPTAMPASQCLKLATRGGAKVLGLARVGRLQTGMLADLIIIDLNKPHLTPFYNSDLLVYAAKGADVKSSIINGQLVMEDRELLTIDVAETIQKVKELSSSIVSTS